MPRKPKILHALRTIRERLGHTQASFAAYIGCSAITVQRIENGSLRMSRKLANIIMEATGADPAALRTGTTGKAMDMAGHEYTKASFRFYHKGFPCDAKEFRYLALTLSHYMQLMLVASTRGGQLKMRAVFSKIQDSFVTIADESRLTAGIHNYLTENGHVDRRKYRVSDLRKFPEFARIIRYKDDKRFSANKIISYNRPKGWILEYVLIESPVLPHRRGNETHAHRVVKIIDNERPMPEELRRIVEQALYWKIEEFRLSFADPPQKP